MTTLSNKIDASITPTLRHGVKLCLKYGLMVLKFTSFCGHAFYPHSMRNLTFTYLWSYKVSTANSHLVVACLPQPKWSTTLPLQVHYLQFKTVLQICRPATNCSNNTYTSQQNLFFKCFTYKSIINSLFTPHIGERSKILSKTVLPYQPHTTVLLHYFKIPLLHVL